MTDFDLNEWLDRHEDDAEYIPDEEGENEFDSQ